MKRTGAVLALLLAPILAFGQGGAFHDTTLKSTAAQGGATVRVCTEAATGTPCAPLASIYSDAALTVTMSNPTTSSAIGNFSFYAVPNRYKLQVSGAGITTYEYMISVPGEHGERFADQFGSLQAAVNDLIANGRLFVPCSTYTLSTQLELPASADVSATKSVTLEGAAPWCVTIQPSVNSITLIRPFANASASGFNLAPNGKTSITGVYGYSGGYVNLSDFRIGAISKGMNLHGDAGAAAGTFDWNIGPHVINGAAYGHYLDTASYAGVSYVNANDFFHPVITGATTEAVHLDGAQGYNLFGGDIGTNTWGLSGENCSQLHFFGTWFEKNFNSGPGNGSGAGQYISKACTAGTFIVGNGWNAWSEPISTTGSITTGTATLSVGSASSIVEGKVIRVSGAGVAAADLESKVTAVSGTTITLADNASTTVSGANCTSTGAGCVTGPVVQGGSTGTFVMGESRARLLGAWSINSPIIGFGVPNSHLTSQIYGGASIGGGIGTASTTFLLDALAGLTETRFRRSIGDGNGTVLSIDYANTRVGIAKTSPTQPLDVTGNINTSTAYYVGGSQWLASLSDNGSVFATTDATFQVNGGTGSQIELSTDNFIKRAGAGTLDVGTTSGGTNATIRFNQANLDSLVMKTPNRLLVSATAPTISSGFGTTPSIATSNGTAAFTVNVGTGGTASSGVIGLPTASNGWNCSANDITTTSATVFLTKQTATTTTSATIANFDATGSSAAWAASDIIAVSCFAR